MSLILSLIDSFLRQRVQPSRPTVRFQTIPIQKAYHKERYDFSDGYSALQILAEEMVKGEVKAVPKPWEPDFGPRSAPSAIRSIEGKSESPPPEYFSQILAQEKYDFSSSSRRPNLSETQPMIYSEYEPSRIDFGEGCSRRRYFYLQPHIAQQQPIAFAKRSSATEENVVRESFQEFMHGTMPKPITQPTIKSSVDMRKEKYSFLEG
jgi:hypothetical protein